MLLLQTRQMITNDVFLYLINDQTWSLRLSEKGLLCLLRQNFFETIQATIIFLTVQDAQEDSGGGDGSNHHLTFHSQRQNRLSLRLVEVDSFGNHSSPHYKGTAVFHRATRGHMTWRGGGGGVHVDAARLGEPVAKMSLTIPKVWACTTASMLACSSSTRPCSPMLTCWRSMLTCIITLTFRCMLTCRRSMLTCSSRTRPCWRSMLTCISMLTCRCMLTNSKLTWRVC